MDADHPPLDEHQFFARLGRSGAAGEFGGIDDQPVVAAGLIDRIELDAAKSAYEQAGIARATLADRIRHVMQAAFAGKRLVVFSGGEAKDTAGLLEEIRQIRDGGGSGSIIGRNSFRRPRAEALALLDQVIRIYRGEA
jgi:class I fructose-bisphosphate aldolase